MQKPKSKKARRQASAARPAPDAAPSASPSLLQRMLVPAFITVLFLSAIFLLPYHIPISTPSSSQSWEFGFNNTVAQGLIALLLLSLFAWQLLFRRLQTAEDVHNDLIARVLLQDEEPLSVRILLYTAAILVLINTAVLLTWYAVLPMSHYGEFTYFIQRVEALILGQKPYVDFTFDYGPSMLALPVGIYHLFRGALSVEDAYMTALIIHFTIGFALIAYIVSQVNTRARILIIAIIGLQWINPSLGLQYTPLRFAIAPASLFAVRHLLRLTRVSPYRMPILAVAGVILPLLSFAISPEMGLALTISLTVYFLWFLFEEERRLALLALAALAGGGAAALIFPSAYFDSIFAFGGGGANFPIFPTVHILAFLAAAIWVFPRLGLIAVRDKSQAAPFCAAFAIILGLFILPATGRCDPGHVWINSLGLLVIALAAASWLEPHWRYVIWIIYFLVFPVFNEVSIYFNYKSPVQNALAIREELDGIHFNDADNYAHLASGAPRPLIHYSKLLPMAGLDLLPKVKIGLPMGDNESMERYLKLNQRNIFEYHIDPYSDIPDPSGLPRKYQDLKKMEYIFVPSFFLNYLRPIDPAAQMQQQGQADNEFLSGLLVFPSHLTPVHPLFNHEAEIMRHIATEYVPYKQYQSGLLLKRRD